jgi:outer membrane protein OmpA-like peptidoglycan-associated protein
MINSTISDKVDYIGNNLYEIKVNERLEDENDIEVFTYVNAGDVKETDRFIINPNSLDQIEEVLKLDNFEAILRFDYDSSELTTGNQILLRQLAEKLPDGSTIRILGSADELGTDQRNKELSNERAENTQNFIQNVSGDKFKIETGINNDKFPEDTPQGRFLNRSIKIIVNK